MVTTCGAATVAFSASDTVEGIGDLASVATGNGLDQRSYNPVLDEVFGGNELAYSLVQLGTGIGMGVSVGKIMATDAAKLAMIKHNGPPPSTCVKQKLKSVSEAEQKNSIFKITNTSEIDSDILVNLKNEGEIFSGGRSGGKRPLHGIKNSYCTTPAGHKLVYDYKGRLIYDISSKRVKMTVWDRAPNGEFYPRDVKLSGPVPDNLLK